MAKAALLFVGTDDGLTMFSDPGGLGRWLRVGNELRGQAVLALWAQHDNPLVVVATAGQNVVRSEDGGRAWQPVLPDVAGVELHGIADAPHELALLAADGTSYRSQDAGRTWAAGGVVEPRAADTAELPGREPVLLRVVPDGIERSADGGATWASSVPDAPWTGAISVVQPSGYHIDTAFAGSLAGQIAISTDRGRTWKMIKQDLPPVRSIAAARLA